MTPSPLKAIGCVALFATLSVTPVDAARQTKQNNNFPEFDQHSIGTSVYGPAQVRRYSRPTRIKRSSARNGGANNARFVDRGCLDASTRNLLDRLESRFGKVALVKVCVPGARMPSGHVSWHARNKAFDFHVPKNVDQRDVMVWLTKNSPGVTISYTGKLAGIIHTDTGTFHKVIYNAANHEAGERAVAIWKERERQGVAVAALPPQRERKSQYRIVQPAPWTATAAYVEPDFEAHDVDDSAPLRPAPITTWGDRRGIFQRYFESREIVARPWVTTSCPNGKALPNGLQALLMDSASHFGRTVYVNSAYRSAAYNSRIRGAARNSQHIQCRAVDFRVAGVSSADVRRYVMANLKRWGITGLGYYGPSGHLHADVRLKATRLVTWTGGHKRYAKRKHQRYAAAG